MYLKIGYKSTRSLSGRENIETQIIFDHPEKITGRFISYLKIHNTLWGQEVQPELNFNSSLFASDL
jgi:hypothetical protein